LRSYPHTTPEAISASIRIVAVSATLPNIQDCAALISACECYTFDHTYRPVPLQTHVVGLGVIGKNEFQFWNFIDRRIPELIHKFSSGKPTIVFCHSKKDTEKLAASLTGSSGIGFPLDRDNTSVACKARTPHLQHCLRRGIAFHHAGLQAHDRQLIEKEFVQGNIRVLTATSTLAVGVNLPVHLVIIKGTRAWRGSGYQDIDSASMLQMIGRAGRPGFDTSGTAVIMTDNQSKSRIERLSEGLGPAESQLEGKLIEVINTEVSQQVIRSSESALNWIKSTLYYTRVRKNPAQFGIRANSDQSIDAFLLEQCEKRLRKLIQLRFIDANKHGELMPLPTSQIMSNNLVDIQASELMVGLPFDASKRQILSAICEIEDLQRPVRRNEKAKLNDAHKNVVKFKLEGQLSKIRVQTPYQKAFVLLQAEIAAHVFEEYTLEQEMGAMKDYAARMLSALEEYSAKGSRNGFVAVQSLKLRRSMAHLLWSEDDGVLKQIQGVGKNATDKLRLHGIRSFQDVLKTTDDALLQATGRGAQFGSQLRTSVSKILKSTLTLSAAIGVGDDGHSANHILCKIEADLPYLRETFGSAERMSLITYTLVAFEKERPGMCPSASPLNFLEHPIGFSQLY
jgi:ATP-dependent DNA helicase HFM1/MER3